MSLEHYYLLGNSGLRVSRLALGTMTFGNAGIRSIAGDWSAGEDDARGIFQSYVSKGGNFIDTADSYASGMSETLVGRFVAELGLRDQMVISTKFSNNLSPGNPNAGGNGRKNMMRAVDASLRRLQTDYVDLYMVHTWDRMTPVEEVMRTLDDLVRAGKIRYAGLSDVPAWYAARAVTWSKAHGLTPPIALQLPYSLVERSIEHEFPAMAIELGMGITAWSPLAMGLLSGKYRSGGDRTGRLNQDSSGGGLGLFTERNNKIVAALEHVATQLGKSMAQVALNWCVNRTAVAAAIVGATRISQIEDNLASLEFDIPSELLTQLNEASAIDVPHPYRLFAADYQSSILNTGTTIGDKPASYRSPLFLPERSDYVFGKPETKR